MCKIGVGILSYNNAELIDNFCEHLREKIKEDVDYIVFDNGSDSDNIPQCTTHDFAIKQSFSIAINKVLWYFNDYDYVWLCLNDFEIVTTEDPIFTMVNKCKINSNIGIIHPSVIPLTTKYEYDKMVKYDGMYGNSSPQKLTDSVCMFFTKKALECNDWVVDTKFVYGWGINYDICQTTRSNGLNVIIDYDTTIKIDKYSRYENIQDKSFRNKHSYYEYAIKTMYDTLKAKYGRDWRKLFE